MEKRTIGCWTLAVDTVQTASFYEQHHQITEDCACIHCANYVNACLQFPPGTAQFFASLGIDSHKEGELMYLTKQDDGSHLYSGFYHLVGQLLEGPDCWQLTTLDGHVSVAELMRVGFTENLALVPAHFPRPVLQLEVELAIPWVLEQPNTDE